MSESNARDVMVPIEGYPQALGTQALLEDVQLLETSPIEFEGRTSMPRILARHEAFFGDEDEHSDD